MSSKLLRLQMELFSVLWEAHGVWRRWDYHTPFVYPITFFVIEVCSGTNLLCKALS